VQQLLTYPRPGWNLLRAVGLLALFAAFSMPSGAVVLPGWSRVEIPATGSYFWRYVPKTLDAAHPAPLVLFLHGSSGTPDLYKNY
jgi:poly(3-hydroxybutyrate) depolymerase